MNFHHQILSGPAFAFKKSEGRFLKVLTSASFDSPDYRYRNYDQYGSNSFYYPTTQASFMSFLSPATTPSPYYGSNGYNNGFNQNNYASRYYNSGSNGGYNQNGYAPGYDNGSNNNLNDYVHYKYGISTTTAGFPFNLFPTTTTYYTTPAPRPFPFNLFPTTTTTTPAPFPLNLFQVPATEPPLPFPLNIFITTTVRPFLGIGK